MGCAQSIIPPPPPQSHSAAAACSLRSREGWLLLCYVDKTMKLIFLSPHQGKSKQIPRSCCPTAGTVRHSESGTCMRDFLCCASCHHALLCRQWDNSCGEVVLIPLGKPMHRICVPPFLPSLELYSSCFNIVTKYYYRHCKYVVRQPQLRSRPPILPPAPMPEGQASGRQSVLPKCQ